MSLNLIFWERRVRALMKMQNPTVAQKNPTVESLPNTHATHFWNPRQASMQFYVT